MGSKQSGQECTSFLSWVAMLNGFSNCTKQQTEIELLINWKIQHWNSGMKWMKLMECMKGMWKHDIRYSSLKLNLNYIIEYKMKWNEATKIVSSKMKPKGMYEVYIYIYDIYTLFQMKWKTHNKLLRWRKWVTYAKCMDRNWTQWNEKRNERKFMTCQEMKRRHEVREMHEMKLE